MAGGNVDDGHHPLAAGRIWTLGVWDMAWLTESSYERSFRDDCQRCADEPIRW